MEELNRNENQYFQEIEELRYEIKRLKARLFEERSRYEEQISSLIKSNEAQAREIQELQAILHNAKDPIFLKNNKLQYIFVNKAQEELLKLAPSQIIGKTDEDIFGNSDTKKDEISVLNGAIIQLEQNYNIENTIKIFHTVKSPIRDIFGKIVGICSISRDITYLKASGSISGKNINNQIDYL